MHCETRHKPSSVLFLARLIFSRNPVHHFRLDGHLTIRPEIEEAIFHNVLQASTRSDDEARSRAHSLHLHVSTYRVVASGEQSKTLHYLTVCAKQPPLWSGSLRTQCFQSPPCAVRCHPALPSVLRGGSRCRSWRPSSR